MQQTQTTADEIRQKVKELVAEVTGIRPEEISDTARFIEELGLDSLMTIEILVMMDKKYQIHIQEEEFSKIKSVKEAVDVVQRYLAVAAQ